MGRSAILNAFPNKANTSLVQPVEVIHLKQLPIELYLAEVIHAFPHEILVVRIDPRPQRTQDEVNVTDTNHLILIVTDILPEHPSPLQASFHHV